MRTLMRRARYRSVFLLALACLLLAVAELRLLHLQILRARAPESSSIYRRFRVDDAGARGEIRDARGGVLATSVREVDVRVWTSGVVATRERDYPALLAERLADLIGADPDETRKKLAEPGKWTLLATGVRAPKAIADLRALALEPGLRALSLETRFVRECPRGPFLAPLVGYVAWQPRANADDDPLADGADELGATRGVAGIEAMCDGWLEPSGGHRLVARDGRQREMFDPDLEEVAARDGRAVELTIEPLAQDLVESAIDGAMAEFGPAWAQIVVLDPSTGDVKAVAQRPTPSQPQPASKDEEEMRRHQFMAAQTLYPPGSSFKPFMLGLVLEQGKCTPDTTVDCENGAASFGKSRVIHDVHPHGILTATQVLVESSNIGMSKLVLRLVPEEAAKGDLCFKPVLDHIVNLGFHRRISGIAGEEMGILPLLKDMQRNYSLASLSFGQEIAVTALQMAAAGAAVANGGTWHAPRLVRAVEDDEGRMVELAHDGAPPHPIFTPTTAATLRMMLQHVVDDGGTKRWRPRGWSMGGKTGTAQNERNHAISISSYWCFAPASDPRFLVLVVLYDPKLGRFAADNAGKVSGTLMGRLLAKFGVPCDRPEEVKSAQDASGVVVLPSVGEGQ